MRKIKTIGIVLGLVMLLVFTPICMGINQTKKTNDEPTPIEEQKGEIKGKFIMAYIYFQAGEVEQIAGKDLISYNRGDLPLKVIIKLNPVFEVTIGPISVEPAKSDPLELKTGDIVSIKFGIFYHIPDTNGLILMAARCYFVNTIQYIE